MNWKNRLTNYNFWISIFSAVLLILQALKIEFNIAYVNEIFTAVLGLLVVIGIISDPTRTTVKSNEATTKQKQETQKVVEAEKKINETAVLPIGKEDEINYNNIQSDIKNVLNQISNDIKQQFEEMRETNNVVNCEKFDTISNEQTDKIATPKIEEIPAPAVAEMENPYFDVIN